MMKHNRQMCQFHEIWLNAFASGGFIKSWLVYDTSLFSFEMYFYLLMCISSQNLMLLETHVLN